MKTKIHQKLFFILFLAGLMTCGWLSAKSVRMYAAETETETATPTPTPMLVKVESVDYETLWLTALPNGHDKVYYSDKSKKVWTEAIADANGKYLIDISWVSNTSKSVLYLKGDKSDDIRSVTLPARNSKLQAKYNKVDGTIAFTSDKEELKEGTFEWRKATSYEWHTSVPIADASSTTSAFHEEIEKMRISGASIYVRLPQITGADDAEGVFQEGSRPSKEIKLSIAKRAAAPKVTVDGSKLVANTKATMEYSLDNGNTWNPATVKKSVLEFLQEKDPSNAGLLYMTQPVTVMFRTAATQKKAFSKTFTLTIPAQRERPVVAAAQNAEVAFEFDEEKFYLTFNNASKTEPYEYTIVKPGTALNMEKASWKSVTSAKKVSVSAKMAPAGSTIYVRKKMIKASKTTTFQLASDMNSVSVVYNAAPAGN